MKTEVQRSIKEFFPQSNKNGWPRVNGVFWLGIY